MPCKLPSFVRLASCALVLVAGVATLGVSAGFAQQPGTTTRSNANRKWTIDTTFSPLRVTTFQTPEGTKVFYSMTFKAVNRTGQDLTFAPSFELVDGDGKVTRSGRGVPAELTKQLIAGTGNSLMSDQISVIGTMLQGEENAKEAVIVFAAEDLTPGPLTVYISGIAGETQLIRVPGAKDASGRDVSVTLRKTRVLSFQDPGDLAGRREEPVALLSMDWVMR